LRLAPWISVIGAAALLLAACKGGSGGGGDGNGGSGASSVEASCSAIEDIETYRYFISLQFDVPEVQPEEGEATPNPLTSFASALTELLRDMQLEGAFAAPDRSQIVIRSGGEEVQVRTIGDKSWIKPPNAGWQEQEPPEDETLFTPAEVCADLVEDLAQSLADGSGEEEVVNGVETVHYRLDEADLEGLPRLLGRSGEEGLPSQFGVDVWLEREQGWPVRLEVVAADTDAQGEEISQELFMEFSDINDPTIEIEPPPVSPAQA
jgi:hypothetical protein